MKTVFVTGVNGLLGTNLTHQLMVKGYFVKGLVRDISRYKGIHSPNLQLIAGDLFDDFSKVLTDVDYVVHAAAVTSQNLLKYSDYLKVNAEASLQLLYTAVKANVKKFVFVSTANTLGHGSMNNPGHEHAPCRHPFQASMYALSKMRAEEQLLQQKNLIDIIVVNPTFMLGAYDTKPSSGKIIMMGWKKKIIFYPPGGKNFVHVSDVACGIMNSFDHGRSGEKYLLAHENLSYKDFFVKLNVIAKQQPFMVQVPKLLLLGMGLLGELLRSAGLKTSLSLNNMKILCTHNYYNNTKSVTELNMRYQPTECAISDAIQYVQHQHDKQPKNKNIKP